MYRLARFTLLAGLVLLAIGTVSAQRIPDQHPPKDVPPVAQLAFAHNGEIDLMSFYEDWPVTVYRMTEEFDFPAYGPEWSEDGLGLAFVGIKTVEKKGQADIYLWDGPLSYVWSDSTEAEHQLAWSPDGSKIAFTQSSDEVNEPELAILTLNTGAVEIVAAGVAPCCHLWMDQSTLAYTSLDDGLLRQIKVDEPMVILPYDGDLPTPRSALQAAYGLPDVENGMVYEAVRSPDGNFIYAIYNVLNPAGTISTSRLYVFDQEDNILVKYDNVHVGDVDWRPMPIARG